MGLLPERHAKVGPELLSIWIGTASRAAFE